MKQLNIAMFDAVAFDLEGTLADTIPAHHKARLAAFAQHGYGHITDREHDLGPTYGSSSSAIIGGILRAAGEISKDGPYESHPVVQAIAVTRMQLFENLCSSGFNEVPGAANFVHLVASRFHNKMTLVTSCQRKFVAPFISRYGLGVYFSGEHVIAEETINELGLALKPEPDPYKLAMERLKSKNMLVFEDTIPGVVAAKRAGATVVALAFDELNLALFQSSALVHPADVIAKSYSQAASILGL